MKKFLLSNLLLLTAVSGFSTTWTITNVSFTFSPDTLTITSGDSVLFMLTPGGFHTGTEVSQATWNANGNTPNGGFNTPFDGGLVLPAQLTTGTHWYVCASHYFMGMKGVIIVNDPMGIVTAAGATLNLQTFPNPFKNKITVTYEDADAIVVYDVLGNNIKSIVLDTGETKIEIDMAALPQGVYFYHLMKEGVIISTKKIVKS